MDDDSRLEFLKKKYNTQKELFEELSLLIDKKIKFLYDDELVQFSKLERTKNDKLDELEKLKSKIEKEETRIAKEFENNIINPPNLDEIKKNVMSENQSIMDDIKIKQKNNTILTSQKQSILQNQQNDLLRIKVQLKSSLLAGQERETYFKEKITYLEKDYSDFINKWNEYLENYNDKKADINETIELLKEEINNKSINKKLERTQLSNFNKEFLKDKRQNKKYVTKTIQDTDNLIKEKDILLTNQNNWKEEKKENHFIGLNELKIVINNSEAEIKELESNILKLEQNLKNNIDDDIKWGIRRNLGELKQNLMIVKETYQSSLIQLNNLQIKFLKEIDNDPFKNEIKKITLKIEKNQSTVNKIKAHETNLIEKDKHDHIENKNRLHKNRFEIKTLSDEIESLDLDIKSFEIKFNEDKQLRDNKLSIIKNELIEHYKYIDQLKQQSKNDINDVNQIYKIKINEHELLIKENTDEITQLKNKSTTILKNFDILTKKCIQDKDMQQKIRNDFQKRKNKLELEKKNLSDIISRYETNNTKYIEYIHEHTMYCDDIKLNTITKIQELHKNLNDTEIEMKKLDFEIKQLEQIVTEEFFIIHDTTNKQLITETDNEILEIEQNVLNMHSIEDDMENDINNFESFLNNTNLETETESVIDINPKVEIETESVIDIDNNINLEIETESVIDIDNNINLEVDNESVIDIDNNINLEVDNESVIDIDNNINLEVDNESVIDIDNNINLEIETESVIDIDNNINLEIETESVIDIDNNINLEVDNESVIDIDNNINLEI
jgi:hypothetical protein